jgi:hypothetical protein
MTTALDKIREAAAQEACSTRRSTTRALVAKGVSFGSITAVPRSGTPCASFDTSRVAGVDADLVVRPFQWKGSVASLRDFNRGASNNELGMQSVEIVGEGLDGDGDQATDELGVGDQTALSIYLAAQPRPTSRLELAKLGLVPALTSAERTAIGNGSRSFAEVGCADCHTPKLRLDDPIFREPSAHPAYRDAIFPSGDDPLDFGLAQATAVRFDLTRDQPDNQILDSRGRLVYHLGALAKDSQGKAQVELYGDLKRHDVGPGLAESIDEKGTGASVFLTENLWGVGSTAPYLHDGRATTLAEAIAAHGGEAASSRARFEGLTATRQAEVIAFLENLVLFKIEVPEEEAAAPEPAPQESSRKKRRR